MLEFYKLNAMGLIVIFVTAIIVYNILKKTEKITNVCYLTTVSVLSGVLVSVIVSYTTLENDKLLNENFWD